MIDIGSEFIVFTDSLSWISGVSLMFAQTLIKVFVGIYYSRFSNKTFEVCKKKKEKMVSGHSVSGWMEKEEGGGKVRVKHNIYLMICQ